MGFPLGTIGCMGGEGWMDVGSPVSCEKNSCECNIINPLLTCDLGQHFQAGHSFSPYGLTLSWQITNFFYSQEQHDRDTTLLQIAWKTTWSTVHVEPLNSEPHSSVLH